MINVVFFIGSFRCPASMKIFAGLLFEASVVRVEENRGN